MLEQFVNDRLAHGRGYFTREEALSAFTSTPVALSAALTRQVKKGRLANPIRAHFLEIPQSAKIPRALTARTSP